MCLLLDSFNHQSLLSVFDASVALSATQLGHIGVIVVERSHSSETGQSGHSRVSHSVATDLHYLQLSEPGEVDCSFIAQLVLP